MCHTLVLCLYRDEKIIIDLRTFGLGLVEVVQVDIRGDKSRIGVQADPRIPVHRSKVFDAIERNKPITDLAAHVKAVAVDAIKAVGKGAV